MLMFLSVISYCWFSDTKGIWAHEKSVPLISKGPLWEQAKKQNQGELANLGLVPGVNR